MSDFCASASASRSYISICTANVGRDRQSATTFWLPFTWAISEINSVIIASCLCCLSDFDCGMHCILVCDLSEVILHDLLCGGENVTLTNMLLKVHGQKWNISSVLSSVSLRRILLVLDFHL